MSQACSHSQIASKRFDWWCRQIRHERILHRKLWEWCYILQAIDQTGMATTGRRGLGFGVGIEPITGWLAAQGCEVVATDLPADRTEAHVWVETNQHATSLDRLDEHNLCDPATFRRLVQFRAVDMIAVPTDLDDFDFLWSSCALEHLGDLTAGTDFVHRSLDCLRPGGVAVHTTEFNVSSNKATVESGPTVAYRRRDLKRLVRELRADGHAITTSFTLGATPEDRHVDHPPFPGPHLQIQLEEHVITSFGLLITKRS